MHFIYGLLFCFFSFLVNIYFHLVMNSGLRQVISPELGQKRAENAGLQAEGLPALRAVGRSLSRSRADFRVPVLFIISDSAFSCLCSDDLHWQDSSAYKLSCKCTACRPRWPGYQTGLLPRVQR